MCLGYTNNSRISSAVVPKVKIFSMHLLFNVALNIFIRLQIYTIYVQNAELTLRSHLRFPKSMLSHSHAFRFKLKADAHSHVENSATPNTLVSNVPKISRTSNTQFTLKFPRLGVESRSKTIRIASRVACRVRRSRDPRLAVARRKLSSSNGGR